MTLEDARELWRAGKSEDALAATWKAYDAAPQGRDEKHLVVRILRDDPKLLTPDRAPALIALLRDPDIEPDAIAPAGWGHLERRADVLDLNASPDAAAARFEGDALALTLLRESPVTSVAAERALTRVRRHLLLADRWRDFPQLSEALVRQAALNGGAWPFGADERAQFEGSFAAAFLPPRTFVRAAARYADAVTRSVAAQYEAWPYPPWRRITRPKPSSVAAAVRARDPDGSSPPEPANILVAGCGTGRGAALVATRYAGDRVTAIDISATSLAYARERCAALGIGGIALRQLDLHAAADAFGGGFDHIDCCGVLHHLPDPEAGWAALARALNPGGTMHIMVYSRVARMRVRAWRQALGPLTARPVDDDLLREVRGRLLALPPAALPTGRDFFTLAGVHDMLLHRHEDPFDIPRIGRALETLGLRFLGFELARQSDVLNYRARHPEDPLRRSFEGWREVERGNPTIFAAMYDLWCRKPL